MYSIKENCIDCWFILLSNFTLVVRNCYFKNNLLNYFGLFDFRDTFLAGHRHLMPVEAQQSQLHFSGSSDHTVTVSLSAAGGRAKEVIVCGPVSVIKVRGTLIGR